MGTVYDLWVSKVVWYLLRLRLKLLLRGDLCKRKWITVRLSGQKSWTALEPWSWTHTAGNEKKKDICLRRGKLNHLTNKKTYALGLTQTIAYEDETFGYICPDANTNDNKLRNMSFDQLFTLTQWRAKMFLHNETWQAHELQWESSATSHYDLPREWSEKAKPNQVATQRHSPVKHSGTNNHFRLTGTPEKLKPLQKEGKRGKPAILFTVHI